MTSIRDLFITIGIKADTAKLAEVDKHLHKVGTAAKWAGAAIAGALSILGGYAIKKAADFEQLDAAFTVMLGSAEKAKKILGELETVASKTSFNFEDIIREAQGLLGRGFKDNEIVPLMMQLSDVAGGLGKDKLPFIAKALSDVKAKGKLLAQESNQFANSGLDIIGEIAVMTGKTKQQMFDMRESGKISEKMVLDAFKRMTSAGGRFYKMAEKQNLTFWGQMSNIKDVGDSLSRVFGKELISALYPIVFAAREWLEANKKIISLRLVEWGRSLGSAVKYIADNFKSIAFYTGVIGAILLSTTFLKTIHALVFAMTTITAGSLITSATWFLLGALALAFFLIIEDIYHYFSGNDSLIGEMAKYNKYLKFALDLWKSIQDVVVGFFVMLFNFDTTHFTDAIKNMFNLFLSLFGTGTTVDSIFKFWADTFTSIGKWITGIIDKVTGFIRGGMSFIGGNFTNPFGMGSQAKIVNNNSTVTPNVTVNVNGGSFNEQTLAQEIDRVMGRSYADVVEDF